LIAALPIIFNRDLVLWPSRVLDYFGARPLPDLSFATLAAIYGVSFVASSDAYFYRVRLDEELSLLLLALAVAAFAWNLEIWIPRFEFSSNNARVQHGAHLRHPELPPVVVFSQGDIGGYVSKEQIGVFMASQLALLRKSNDGNDPEQPTKAGSSAHTGPGSAKQPNKKRRISLHAQPLKGLFRLA
jgi:hypothetical protein